MARLTKLKKEGWEKKQKDFETKVLKVSAQIEEMLKENKMGMRAFKKEDKYGTRFVIEYYSSEKVQ